MVRIFITRSLTHLWDPGSHKSTICVICVERIDASRFGSAYLAKFGWDSGKGLGAAGVGRTSHIKVAQKLDMLGIGAANTRDPDGIAWKQNRDFENLLKRLNGEGEDQEHENGGTKVEGFERQGKEGHGSEEVAGEGLEREGKRQGKKEKRHKKGGERDEEGGEERDKESKKKKKRRSEGEEEDSNLEGRKKRKRKDKEDKAHKRKTDEESEPRETTRPPSAPSAQPIIPRHRAHRARAIAAKKMLSSSARAVSEILGIAPMPTPSTPSGSTSADGRLTAVDDDIAAEGITTSKKSMADYFKEKLLSKSSGNSGSSTPTSGKMEDAYDTPRGGLGLSRG
ncbi:hypothetical protein AX15_003448 [Amanita polypyramis BW_CC]|nr:hypothetical protein AX15_003448 [Amanita polypyramis BW_CC]